KASTIPSARPRNLSPMEFERKGQACLVAVSKIECGPERHRPLSEGVTTFVPPPLKPHSSFKCLGNVVRLLLERPLGVQAWRIDHNAKGTFGRPEIALDIYEILWNT